MCDAFLTVDTWSSRNHHQGCIVLTPFWSWEALYHDFVFFRLYPSGNLLPIILIQIAICDWTSQSTFLEVQLGKDDTIQVSPICWTLCLQMPWKLLKFDVEKLDTTKRHGQIRTVFVATTHPPRLTLQQSNSCDETCTFSKMSFLLNLGLVSSSNQTKVYKNHKLHGPVCFQSEYWWCLSRLWVSGERFGAIRVI